MVSIIIPTYNRYNLIGATLDSILNQTYENWECIIIDDGSRDYTSELLEFYCKHDKRIKYHHRPTTRRKGANACRNFGFELSSGKYIQWFDSDDLMVPEFLSIKIKAIEENNVDFVISKTVNFQDPDIKNIVSENVQYYSFDHFEINNYNYVTQNINWLTCDFFVNRRVVAEVKFNENLSSAQERNFFSKLTCHSTASLVLNKFLTIRRVHHQSTQARLREDKAQRNLDQFHFFYETWKDLKEIGESDVKDFLFLETMKLSMTQKTNWKVIFQLTFHFWKEKKKISAFWYFFYQFSHKLFNRGHLFRLQLKKQISL